MPIVQLRSRTGMSIRVYIVNCLFNCLLWSLCLNYILTSQLMFVVSSFFVFLSSTYARSKEGKRNGFHQSSQPRTNLFSSLNWKSKAFANIAWIVFYLFKDIVWRRLCWTSIIISGANQSVWEISQCSLKTHRLPLGDLPRIGRVVFTFFPV